MKNNEEKKPVPSPSPSSLTSPVETGDSELDDLVKLAFSMGVSAYHDPFGSLIERPPKPSK